MTRPVSLLEEVQASTDRLLRRINGLTDRAARGPSHLPGWTRGHVLTHLARNADAQVRMIEGSLAGQVVEQYVGGPAGRADEIEAGAPRTGRDLVDDVTSSAERLQAAWDAMPDDAWALMQQSSTGPRSIERGVRSRWREVEVHFLDLDLLYTSADWPNAFVHEFLPSTLDGMAARAVGTVPATSWVLREEATGAAWLIDGTGTRSGPDDASHHIVGPAHALLAWVWGRSFSSALQVEKSPNEALALMLPRFFPPM
jgi:maleylpyruvate isomerase